MTKRIRIQSSPELIFPIKKVRLAKHLIVADDEKITDKKRSRNSSSSTLRPTKKKRVQTASPLIMSKKFTIKGCESFEWFQVEKRNQYILLVGEGHHYKGNSLEFVRQLIGNYNCPIDVITELPFETYWKPATTYKQSNSTLFRRAKERICFDPTKIPPQSQMKSGEFFNVCIKPFEGKLRIWAEDRRPTSIFSIFMTATFELFEKFEKKYKDKFEKEMFLAFKKDVNLNYWFSIMKLCMKSFFNFRLYQQNPQKYHDEIITNLKLLYDNKPQNIKDWFNKHIDEILKSKDKSHLDFAEDMIRHFSSAFLEKLRRHIFTEIEKDNLVHIFLNFWFFDVSVLLRIKKIIERQSNGLIISFMGDYHLETISSLLSLKDTGSLKLEKKEKIRCQNQNIVWDCPLHYCNKNSKLMDIYLQCLKEDIL